MALIGLIFGFVTWRATQAETKSAVLLADRERVADLALELSTIPLDELEATSTWGASTASTVSAHLNARQVQVIQQMLEVIERADREIATASQQVALADALVRTGEHAAAVDHYDRALRLSDSFGLAVHALRGKAAALHQMNVISDARAAWEEAVQIADDYRLPKDFVVLSEIQTLSNWGSWEALTGECDRARRMRARTTELAETLMRLTTGNKAYAARVTQLQQPLVDALQSCA